MCLDKIGVILTRRMHLYILESGYCLDLEYSPEF